MYCVHCTNHCNVSEVDDDYCTCDKHLSMWKVITVKKNHESEGDGSPQAPVRHDELIYLVQLDNSDAVSQVC